MHQAATTFSCAECQEGLVQDPKIEAWVGILELARSGQALQVAFAREGSEAQKLMSILTLGGDGDRGKEEKLNLRITRKPVRPACRVGLSPDLRARETRSLAHGHQKQSPSSASAWPRGHSPECPRGLARGTEE